MADTLVLSPPEEPQLLAHVEATRLDGKTDDELDELPFRIVALSPTGKVLRYNLAESRLARLDRSTVRGRDFFREVAPCTATPELEGRFSPLVRSGESGPVRFPYVFDFAFGAQEVEVELLRASAERVYLLINRLRFTPPRPPGARRKPAPRQPELPPDESRKGVIRDATECASFASSRRSGRRCARRGTAWLRMGGACSATSGASVWGRTAVIDLETDAVQLRGVSLRELPMRAAIDMLGGYLFDAGWGSLKIDFRSASDGVFIVELERSAWAEAIGPSPTPRCHVLAGFFRAVFCHLAQKLVTVRELSCRTQGETCAFAVVAQERKSGLDEAVERAKGNREVVLAAFRESSRARRSWTLPRARARGLGAGADRRTVVLGWRVARPRHRLRRGLLREVLKATGLIPKTPHA